MVLALPILATLAVPAAAMPVLHASERGCRDGDVVAAWEGDAVRLQLAPHRDYVGWLEEDGVDVAVALPAERGTAAGAAVVWADSAPQRYAREPLRLHSDADGQARIALRLVGGGSEPGRLRLQLQCSAALSAAEHRHWRRLWAFVSLHAAYREAGAAAAGAPLFWRALDLLTAADTPETARHWLQHQLGSLVRAAGGLREAERWYALAERAETGDPRRAALAALGRAQMRFGLGEADAGEWLLAAQRRLLALNMPYPAAVAGHDGCLAQRVRGEIAAAAACLRDAAAAFAGLGERDEQSNALRNRATALLMLGRYREAGAALRLAIGLAEGGDDPRARRQRSLAAWVQAQLSTWGGDFERALALLHDAAREREQAGADAELAHTHRLIADTYALAGEPDAAASYYRAALAYYEAKGLSGRAVPVRMALAGVLEDRDAAGAGSLLRQARTDTDPAVSPTRWSEASLRLARWSAAHGQAEAARQLLSELASAGVSLPWKHQAEAALLEARLGIRRDSAVERLAEFGTRARESGQALLQLDIQQALIELALDRGDTAPALRLADAAVEHGLRVAGQLRSPSLRHAMLDRLREPAALRLRLRSAGPLDAESARSALAVLERLRRVEQAALPMAGSDDALTELERRIGSELLAGGDDSIGLERERRLLAWYRELAQTARGREAPLAVAEPGAPQEGEVWLYFVQGRTWAGGLRRDGSGWYWHPGLDAAAVRASAAALRARLASGHGGREAIDADVAALADVLHWPRLLPAAPLRLAVVAGAELAGVPWELLPAADGQPLSAHSEVVLWQSLQARPALRPARLHVLTAGQGAEPGLATLPQVDAEAAAVVAQWPALPATVHAAAGRAQLMAALVEPGSLVHVAGHGRADAGRSEESGLWLQHDGKPDFVSALRLRRWPVRSALVVLGACESGYSGSFRRFGVGGVAGSLVDAGAGAAVGSRWPVSDRAAQAFADAFHRALARQPLAPVAALRAAQTELRQRPAWRHPAHWAGWFLLQPGPVEPAVPRLPR